MESSLKIGQSKSEATRNAERKSMKASINSASLKSLQLCVIQASKAQQVSPAIVLFQVHIVHIYFSPSSRYQQIITTFHCLSTKFQLCSAIEQIIISRARRFNAPVIRCSAHNKFFNANKMLELGFVFQGCLFCRIKANPYSTKLCFFGTSKSSRRRSAKKPVKNSSFSLLNEWQR